MPLANTGVIPDVLVIKRPLGYSFPSEHTATLDSCNQIDYQKAKWFASWDSGSNAWKVLCIDTSQAN